MRRKILLVEDNRDDAELTVSTMKAHGVDADIEVVEDGIDALEYFSRSGRHANRSPGLPDLAIIDLNLPRMNGIELLQKLRADPQTRRLPIVILTSSIQQQDVARSYDSGANSYVRKPVDYDEFVRVARRLGEYWLFTNHPAPPSAT